MILFLVQTFYSFDLQNTRTMVIACESLFWNGRIHYARPSIWHILHLKKEKKFRLQPQMIICNCANQWDLILFTVPTLNEL